jgi:hypothetical protein
MSGTPTEAEIQTQWSNVVDILETIRAHADGTMAGGGGKFDTLLQSLEGEYTPSELANAVQGLRSAYSSMIESSTVLEFLTPILFEYGKKLADDATGGYGSGFRDVGQLFTALYEWFIDNSLTVQSRVVTYDSTATAGAGNVGDGAMNRLTVDHNNHTLEAVTVEKKTFRCRSDQNTGTEENAEVFEVLGEQASFDALLRSSYGSGEASRTFIRSKHAGTGSGGSLLQNSSFSTFDSTASPKFAGWTESAGGSNLAQDTTNFYRSHPGAQTDAALKITGGGGTVTLKQTLSAMRTRRLDIDTPYFFRVMLNKTVGTAVGGTVTIRMGSHSGSVTIAGMGSGWVELIVPLTLNAWPRNFNEDPFDVEIEWATSTSGFLLVDDAIFCPMDLVDGSWWILRGNADPHLPWLVDDTLTFTDSGGAPTTGKIQWWLWVAGLGYLPSTSGTPTFADP